jgi:chloramphenicol 3-O-phosphotransferase
MRRAQGQLHHYLLLFALLAFNSFRISFAERADIVWKNGMDHMQLIFLHGAPAVGKLTIARELAELTGVRLFHNHLTVDLVTSLFPFGSESFVRLREQIWLATFAEAARNGSSLIFTFNPERTVRERFVPDVLDTVESAGGRVVFVELTCAEAELERRMENPSRQKFGKLASVVLYRSLKRDGAFDFAKLPDGITLDTTNQTPAATAQAIAEAIK